MEQVDESHRNWFKELFDHSIASSENYVPRETLCHLPSNCLVSFYTNQHSLWVWHLFPPNSAFHVNKFVLTTYINRYLFQHHHIRLFQRLLQVYIMSCRPISHKAWFLNVTISSISLQIKPSLWYSLLLTPRYCMTSAVIGNLTPVEVCYQILQNK